MWTFSETKKLIKSGGASCVSIVEDHIQKIEKNRELNAFLSIFADSALEQSRLIDTRVADGVAGPLAGMIVAVKDNICTSEGNTTCGSKILESFHSPYNATVVARLKAADAIIIGKTNLDEFGMGSSTENSAFGRVKLPQDIERVSGGSSGGSAVAIAS